MKSNCFKRLLALRIEGVDIRLYLFQALFFRKRKHIDNASASDVKVLVLLTNNNTDLRIVSKGNIPDKRAAVLDIVTISMRTQISIHAIQQIQIIGVVDVINLFAHIKVLIPGKRNFRIWIIWNQRSFLINNSLFHLLSSAQTNYRFTSNSMSYSSLPFSTKPMDFQKRIESSFMLFSS